MRMSHVFSLCLARHGSHQGNHLPGKNATKKPAGYDDSSKLICYKLSMDGSTLDACALNQSKMLQSVLPRVTQNLP